MEYSGKIMDLGSMVAGAGGNSSTSTSNLSAFAPPFTVDRFSPNFYSNPVFRYLEMPYDAEPYSRTSQFSRPSAPSRELDNNFSSSRRDDHKFSAPIPVNPSGSYWSAPSTTANSSGFLYRGEVNPYYSPLVPSVNGEDSHLIEDFSHRCKVLPPSVLNLSGRRDEHRWVDSIGLSAGNWSNNVDPVGSFTSNKAHIGSSNGYKCELSQGRDDISFGKKSQELYGASYGNLALALGSEVSGVSNGFFGQVSGTEPSGTPYGNLSKVCSKEVSGTPYGNWGQFSDTEVYTRSLPVGNLEEKSFLEHDLNIFSYGFNKTQASSSTFMFPESRSFCQSGEMMQNVYSFQNSCSPCEKCVMPADSFSTSAVSVVRSSPVVVRPPPATNDNSSQSATVVIRPPPAANDIFGQIVTSCCPIYNDSAAAAVHYTNFDHSSPPDRRDPDLKQISAVRVDSIPPSSVKEMSSSLQAKDSFAQKVISSHGSQLPNLNIPFDFPPTCDRRDPDLNQISAVRVDTIPPSSVKEMSSSLQAKDCFAQNVILSHGSQLPNLNIPVDFPPTCDTIQMVYSADNSLDLIDHLNPAVDSPCWKGASSSQFQAFDSGSGNSYKKSVGMCNGFDCVELENLLPINESMRSSSKKLGQIDNNNDNEFDRNGLLKLETTTDATFPSGEKVFTDGAKTRNGITAVIIGEGCQTSNEPIILRDESCLQTQLKDGLGMNILETENFNIEEDLFPNDISEGGTVAVRMAEKVLASPPLETATDRAELLPHTKLDVETVIMAMHNLSELLLCYLSSDAYALDGGKNIEILKSTICSLEGCVTKKFDLSTSKLISKNLIDTSEKLGNSHSMGTISCKPAKTNKTMNCQAQFDYQGMNGENKFDNFFTYKSVKSPILSPSDETRDDDMTKAIKRVLDENLHFDEEIQPQARLFKNLWLEAEAKLCSINYISRFDRMKVKMGNFETNMPKESEDVAKMISSGPNNAPMLSLKAHGSPSPNNAPISKSEHVGKTYNFKTDFGDPEASIMARSMILKSREKQNLMLIDRKDDEQSMDGEDAGSIRARLNILRSRNTSPDMEKEQRAEMAVGAHAAPVMARFNILKSREDTQTSAIAEKGLSDLGHSQDLVSRPVRLNTMRPQEESSKFVIEKEQQHVMGNGEFSGKNNRVPSARDHSEAEFFEVAPILHSSHQSNKLSDAKCGSYMDGSTLTPHKELHLSVASDPRMRPGSRFLDTTAGLDWEHIQIEDFT